MMYVYSKLNNQPFDHKISRKFSFKFNGKTYEVIDGKLPIKTSMKVVRFCRERNSHINIDKDWCLMFK